mgnify:CR=1 FL=1
MKFETDGFHNSEAERLNCYEFRVCKAEEKLLREKGTGRELAELE